MRATKKQARTQPKLPAGKVRTLEPGALGMGRAGAGTRGTTRGRLPGWSAGRMIVGREGGRRRTGGASGASVAGSPTTPWPVQP